MNSPAHNNQNSIYFLRNLRDNSPQRAGHRIEMKDNYLFFQENEHSYAMFIPPDMQAVKIFRAELRKSLKSNGFIESDIFQIELACDEAVTNSITANVINQSDETIICRWKVNKPNFTLCILDNGRGISDKNLQGGVHNISEEKSSLENYLTKLKETQPDKPRVLPFSGIKKEHKNLGQGLKIIHKLMSTVQIMYHGEKNEILEKPPEGKVSGSILKLAFHSEDK
jgi:anti-sigma regulatory factor (Ser/Thr protein kinase)